MKFEYIVVYENNSDKFDIGNCWFKVKVTERRPSKVVHIYRNTNCQVLFLNFGTSLDAYIKHIRSYDNNIKFMNIGKLE